MGMLDDVAELLVELGADWLIDRNSERTLTKQACLVLGVVTGLVAAVITVLGNPLASFVVGTVALALLFAGL